MAVGLAEPEDLHIVKGVSLAAVTCGIKKSRNRDDLVLLLFQEGSVCAATFTKNVFCAAPVVTAKNHLLETSPRAFLINSGNANAGLGEPGLRDAAQSCAWVAEALGISSNEVLPFSTGVIGEPMPMDALQSGITAVSKKLREDNWMAAAKAIMTTDTIAKGISKQVMLDGKTITITGIAKGSGMICPNMATMLAFVATDASVDRKFLQACLNEAVDSTFNAITVDGDTSTNDACVVVATGASTVPEISSSYGADEFKTGLMEVCTFLAQAIVRDGEGATKFMTVKVVTALSVDEAREVCYTIAHSPLIKTAFFASDPNWGRILAAVGRTKINHLEISKVNIFLDDVCIVNQGEKDKAYTEEAGARVMRSPEITIKVELGRGQAEATVWTTDLSHDYVTINSDYRS